jgi:hypothetical protein
MPGAKRATSACGAPTGGARSEPPGSAPGKPLRSTTSLPWPMAAATSWTTSGLPARRATRPGPPSREAATGAGDRKPTRRCSSGRGGTEHAGDSSTGTPRRATRVTDGDGHGGYACTTTTRCWRTHRRVASKHAGQQGPGGFKGPGPSAVISPSVAFQTRSPLTDGGHRPDALAAATQNPPGCTERDKRRSPTGAIAPGVVRW